MPFREDLRWILVSFLFSVTLAEIARQAARLVALRQMLTFADAAPTAARLLLTSVVVTTSWVGWSLSINYQPPVKGVFSWPFVVLLIDVGLVICYFIMAHGTEMQNTSNVRTAPSASLETVLLIVILVGYTYWGLVVHGVIGQPSGFDWVSWIWASAVCLPMAAVAWLIFGRAKSPGAVVVSDVGLIALVVFYRSFKSDEPLESVPVIFFALYASCLGLAWQLNRRAATLHAREAAIRRLAFRKWQEAGSPADDSLTFWFAAEREILSSHHR